MKKNDGTYNFLKTSVILVLCFILAFAPVVGEVAPAIASAAGKAAGTGGGEKTPRNLLGGTASIWGSLLTSASAGEEPEPAVNEIVFDDIYDNTYTFLGELLSDERLKSGLSEAMARVAANGDGTTLEDLVIGVLEDVDLRANLSGVLASYLRLEEGSAEREFFQQITLDLFALLQDDSKGSIKAFLKNALGEFMEQPDVEGLISDIFGVVTNRLTGIIDDLSEQNVLDEVPGMFELWLEDFMEKTTGVGADEDMAAVVVGIMENANVISEDFALALAEDEGFVIAMEHLSDAILSQLLDPLMVIIEEEFEPFMNAISPVCSDNCDVNGGCTICSTPCAAFPTCGGLAKDCPNCKPLYPGLMGSMSKFLDGLMQSDCATCNNNEYPGYIGDATLSLCPDCPDNLGTVLKLISADLNANIAHYSDAALGGEIISADGEIEPSDALVKAEMGAFLMHWFNNLINLIGNDVTSEFLMGPIGDYFATGEGQADIEDIFSTLNNNFMRVYVAMTEEGSPIMDVVRQNLSYPLFGASRYGEYEGDSLVDKLTDGLMEILGDVLDQVSLEDDVTVAAENLGQELNMIIEQIFPAYFIEEEEEDPTIVLEGDMIDELIDTLLTFQSFADPEGEEVMLYQLAGDISVYMNDYCDDIECGCGGLLRADCQANKLVANLLDGVVDGFGAICVDPDCPDEGCTPTTPCQSCLNYCSKEALCPACQLKQEEETAADGIRTGLLSVARLDQFYKDLLGPRGPGYEYQYAVTGDSGMLDIVLAVFKEILGGEEFDSYLAQLQGTGAWIDNGWMDQLLDEPDTGLLAFGRRMVGSAFGFLDRIFAPVMKLIYPRRYIYEYDEAEQRRLKNMVTEERMNDSLRWIIAPVQGMLVESKLAQFASDPENPGEYLTFPDFLIDQFVGYEHGGNTGLGILVSPQRLTTASDLASELIGSEDLKELSARYFAESIAKPAQFDGMFGDVTDMLNPLTGDIKITEMVNGLIEGLLNCPECEGTGLINELPCANCVGVGQLDQLEIPLAEYSDLRSGGQESLFRIAAMIEEFSAECVPCGGTGLIAGGDCERCNGSGRPQTDYDCPFCNGVGCIQCGDSGKTRPSLVIPNIPALLLEDMDSCRALGDYQAAAVGPVVSALAGELRGAKARQIIYDLGTEALHILIDGLGTVLTEIVANENGELLYIQETFVEILTFGDLPQKINKLLTGFLKDPNWLGYCDMQDARLAACSNWNAHDHTNKTNGCNNKNDHPNWNEPVPVDAFNDQALGTRGSGLEYLLRLSLYYTIWNKEFPHNVATDPYDKKVTRFNYNNEEGAPNNPMQAGWARFWTVNYTAEACAFNIFASEVAHASQIGITRFNNRLLQWLRGEANFTGNDPLNPAVLQRPANFIPTYVEDYYRDSLAGEFVPDLVEVIVNILEEVFNYEDEGGRFSDYAIDLLMPMIFTNPDDPANEAYPWLLGDIADVLEKEYGTVAEKKNLSALLEDVIIGVPDANGIREMKMLDELAAMLKYDPAVNPPPNEQGNLPVWLLEEHMAVTFSNIVNKFSEFILGGWGVSAIPTLKQSGGDVYIEHPLEQSVEQTTVRIFKPCGVCAKCTAVPSCPHECENPAAEAVDVPDSDCTCGECASCLNPTGTFTGTLVKAGGPRNAIDYNARTIELSVNAGVGDELVIFWMPGLLTYLTLNLEADALRSALKLPEAPVPEAPEDPVEPAPFDNLIYNNILKYIRHIDPVTGEPLGSIECQFCEGNPAGCGNCNGGYLENSASEQLCEYLLTCTTCGGDGLLGGGASCPDCDGGTLEIGSEAPGFRAGYIIEDIPSRLIVDLLTDGATPLGDPSHLAEHGSGVVSGLLSDTLMNYRMGGRFLVGAKRVIDDDNVFKALADTLFGFFSGLLETFTRRITSFGGLLAGADPAPVQSQALDAGDHDYDPAVLQAMPSVGVDTLALLAGVRAPEEPVQAAEVEIADAQTLANDIIKALRRMDMTLIDEFINAMLDEAPFKENVSPLIGLLGEIIGDEDLAGIIGAVLAGNLQDGRLDEDINYIFNTVTDFLADEEINKVSRQFVYAFLNSEEILGDGGYVENLITEGVEIGFALLRDIVDNILLLTHPENPKVPAEETEIVKMIAKQFVSTARKEFEGYEGFAGYEENFKALLTDPRLGELVQSLGEILGAAGIDLGLDLLEDQRTQPILSDIVLVTADYLLSGLENVFAGAGLTDMVFESVDNGIKKSSGDNTYKFLQDAISNLVEDVFYGRDGTLFSYLSANFYKVMELCGLPSSGAAENGVCNAKCRINPALGGAGQVPTTDLVSSIHPQLAIVPPELIIDVMTNWLVYGGGKPGAGTMSDWARNIGAQVRPQLIMDADPTADTLFTAFEESQDFLYNLLQENHALGGKTGIMNALEDALNEYSLPAAAGTIRNDSYLDKEAAPLDFQYYRWATIDRAQLVGAKENFPIYIKLDAGNFDFSKARADGADIHFRLADPAHPARPGGAAQKLSFERAYYDPVGKVAEFFVLFPELSNTEDTRFMICYGGAAQPDSSAAVWKGAGRNYNLVYHLRDAGLPVKDSTGVHNGTKTGAIPLVTIGGRTGLDFRANNNWINSNKTGLALGIGTNTPKTIEAWAYTTGFNNGGIFDVGTNAEGQTIGMRTEGTANQWLADFWHAGQNQRFSYPSQNAWVHFAITYSGGASGQMRVYLNGEQVAITGNANFSLGTTNTFRVGYWTGANAFFEGVIDEVRISNVARPANWIRASYNSGLGNIVKNIGAEIRSDYYIPRELATVLVDILPLEQIGNILNIPVYTDQVGQDFTGAGFPPTGWTRITPTANQWVRDAVVGRNAAGAAKFPGTEAPILLNQTLLTETFDRAMFPPPGWRVDVVESINRVGKGWHKHATDATGGIAPEAASSQWVDSDDWEKVIYDNNTPKGVRTHHVILNSPWFSFATGTASLSFFQKKAGQAARFTHAKVGVEYREGGLIKRHELASYTEAQITGATVNLTIPNQFAGKDIRVYFDYKGTYDLVSTSNIGYFKWIVDTILVTGSRYGVAPLGEGWLISAPVAIDKKYVLEYYESSQNRDRFQKHGMGILNEDGVVVYRTELGRAPEYPEWARRRLDLSEYADQTIRFFFDYYGIGGDTWLLDDFMISGFDRYLGEGAGDPQVFEQLEEAGHYAVDILPLVGLIDAIFADEAAIKGALDLFIGDVAKGAIQVLGRSDIFFSAVDVLREFPIEVIGDFLREEYEIPCGYCEGCGQTPAVCELSPALVGLTRAEYIGQILPEILLGAGTEVILGEDGDGSELTDLIYGLIMGIIEDVGGGSPGKTLADLAVGMLICGECAGCTADPPEPCASNKLIPILESLYELLGVSSSAEVQEVADTGDGDEEDAGAAYYADTPNFFTSLWSDLYRAAVNLFGGATDTATEEPVAQGPEITTSAVLIPDEGLKKAISYALLKESDEAITVSDMQKLYALSACDRGITDITGLEEATNLTYLDLYGNDIADLSPLAGLTNLEGLHLSYGGLGNADIAALSGLTKLDELDLAHNNITDLTALAGLTKLEVLNLNGNAITSVAPLAEMTIMKRLFLADNNISSIAALQNMTALERLNLSGNADLGTAGFAALAGKSALERLNVNGTGISGVIPAPIAGLTGLENLDLGTNGITNLGGLATMTGLETLKISANALTDARLATVNWNLLANLRSLNLSNNQIANLAPLAGLTDLTELVLADNNITALTQLAGLTALERLNLSNNGITNLTQLDWTTFKALRYLYLASNNDSFLLPLNLSPLGGAATPEEDRLNLVELDLSDNCIDDISALAGVNFIDALWGFKAWLELGSSLEFEGIEYLDGERGGFLDLSDNYIYDTTPLAGKKLQTLDLANNEISDAHVLEDVNFSGMVINGLVDLSENWIAKMEAVGAPAGLDALNLRDNYLKISYNCIRPNRCDCGKELGDKCAWVEINRFRQNSIIVADEDQNEGAVPQGVMVGQIFNPGGEPLAGAEVEVWEESAGAELQLAEAAGYYHTYTRADGSFRLPLPEGNYRVQVTYAEFNPVELEDLEIQKVGPSLDVQKIYIDETVGLSFLRGKVVNAAGDALDNVQVMLKEEEPGGITTNEVGEYELLLPAGDHAVEIRHDGYIPVTLNITVLENGTVEGAAETVVMDLLTCVGSVVDISGPKFEAQITATGDGGNKIVVYALEDGTFTLGSFDELLRPGTYRVEVKLADHLTATAALTVNADGTIEGWNGEFVLELWGDVSNDGSVGVEDAILILKHIVGLTSLDDIPGALDRARVTGGEELNIRDAILILRHIVGLINTFPAATD